MRRAGDTPVEEDQSTPATALTFARSLVQAARELLLLKRV